MSAFLIYEHDNTSHKITKLSTHASQRIYDEKAEEQHHASMSHYRSIDSSVIDKGESHIPHFVSYIHLPIQQLVLEIMAIDLLPLPLPESADPTKFTNFGREVKGFDPATFSPEQFEELKDALYKVHNTLFRYLPECGLLNC